MFILICFIVLLSLILTGLVRNYTVSKSIIDVPNERSSHTSPTPRGGGFAVAISWFAGLIFLFFQRQINLALFCALLLGIPLMLIGLFDDILNLKPGIRFLIQICCSAVALFFLEGLKSFHFGLWSVDCASLLFFIAFIAIVWSINLFNFLDGIDGYIGTEVVFIGLASFALTGDILGLMLAAATLGFLFWNWQKAKIFMGDVGSTLLGFTIAVLAIYHQNSNISSIWVWIILTSVFWFDATVTLFRRFINKERLSEAHKKHAYQRIVQSGFSHQKTTLWALGLNLIGFGFAWLAKKYVNIAIWFLFLDIALLFFTLRVVDKKRPFEYGKRK